MNPDVRDVATASPAPKQGSAMTVARNTPNWIIAVVAIGATFYWLRNALAPLAVAVILWLAIDSLGRALKRRAPVLPLWLALAASMVLVLGLVSLIVYVLARNIGEIAANAHLLQARIEAIALDIQRGLGFDGAPWTIRDLLAQASPVMVLANIAGAVQSLAGNTTLILIYLLFLFPAAAAFSRKLPAMIPDPEARVRAEMILGSIRTSIERYLLVQTAMSLLISVLSYATLSLIGLANPLFWSFLIFFLNYIPSIGSIIAVALPTLFALLQFPDWRGAAAVAIGLHIWQFGIGTFVQPRMTGASVNLSTIVVVISLALWGGLWGLTGVFLAAPLTVLVMIVLEQFPQTRWIAVLLSADGRPAPAVGGVGPAAS